MLNSHFWFKFLLLAFVFPSLACGMQAVTADTRQAREMSTAVSPSLSAAPVPDYKREMVVTADSVHIRLRPDPHSTIVGWLENGDVVTIIKPPKEDDYGGEWCRHDRGWTNCRYLEAR